MLRIFLLRQYKQNGPKLLWADLYLVLKLHHLLTAYENEISVPT